MLHVCREKIEMFFREAPYVVTTGISAPGVAVMASLCARGQSSSAAGRTAGAGEAIVEDVVLKPDARVQAMLPSVTVDTHVTTRESASYRVRQDNSEG